MADGLTTQTTTLATIPGSSKIATDEDATLGHAQIVKLGISADGDATPIPADATNGLDVDVTRSALPSGASTSAKQDTVIGHLDGVETLLGTIDADTGGILTAVQTLDNAIAGTEMQVDVVAALPAGTNNIGDVDVASIAAGDNNIGNVDIASIAAGDNNIGNVDIVSSALPTGASTSANQTTIIGHVDGIEALLTTIDADTSGIITATQLLDNTIVVDDAAFTPASTSVNMAGFQADEASTDSVDEGDAGAARMTLDRKQIVVPQGHAAGGLTIFRSLDLDESEEEVKATAGTLYGWYIANLATTTRFVKFYNLTAANTTVGSSTPVMTLAIPGNSTDDIAANALGGVGIKFDTAISVAATTGVADADTGAPGANDVVVNLFYA